MDENAITCQTLATNGNIEIGLQNPCDGFWTINSCPPLYVSVQSNTGGSAASTAVCTGKYLIEQTEYLGARKYI